MSTHPTPEHIMQVGLGFWASKTLLSAIGMGLFTELADHPESLESLRERLVLHERSARDFLDALVALGFLERRDGVYANTPATDLFLDRRKPSYIGGILEMANHRLYGFWGSLTEALRTGRMQNGATTGDLPYEALHADPARLQGFLAAMTGISHGANLQIAERFPWGERSSFVDVGTAQGDLAVQIALAHPHLQGVGFDLPGVAPAFEEYVGNSRLGDRLSRRVHLGDGPGGCEAVGTGAWWGRPTRRPSAGPPSPEPWAVRRRAIGRRMPRWRTRRRYLSWS